MLELHMPSIAVNRRKKTSRYAPICGRAGLERVMTASRPVSELTCIPCIRYAEREEYEPDQESVWVWQAAS